MKQRLAVIIGAGPSGLTAAFAVDNIATGSTDKENIWTVNTEQEYHEEK